MWELISQPSEVLKAIPMVASSPPLTRGLGTNKKNEIPSEQSQDTKLPQFRGGKFKSNVWYRKKLLEKLKTLAKGKPCL